jgi:DNA (cytosine-5)-methyltransferase 1
MFSALARMVRHNGHEPKFGNLIPEFERCVAEAAPRWFLMENVPAAPRPVVDGYVVRSQVVNNRWFDDGEGFGAEQNRTRALSFGTEDGRGLAFDVALWERTEVATGVTSSDGGGVMRGRPRAVHSGSPTPSERVREYVYSLEDACELQGLPRDFTEHMPFCKDAKLKAVANGVPLPMGRAIARAVKRAVWST